MNCKHRFSYSSLQKQTDQLCRIANKFSVKYDWINIDFVCIALLLNHLYTSNQVVRANEMDYKQVDSIFVLFIESQFIRKSFFFQPSWLKQPKTSRFTSLQPSKTQIQIF